MKYIEKHISGNNVYLICAIVLCVCITGCSRFRLFQPVVSTEREPVAPADVVTYNIQVGLYDTQDEAEIIVSQVKKLVTDRTIIVYKAPFYRIWIVSQASSDIAEDIIALLSAEGFTDARRIFDEEY